MKIAKEEKDMQAAKQKIIRYSKEKEQVEYLQKYYKRIESW